MKNVIDIIKQNEIIDLPLSFKLAKKCSTLLSDKSKFNEGLQIIIYVLENWDKFDKSTEQVWIDLIEIAGFYPYLEKNDFNLTSTDSMIRKGYFKSNNLDNYYFHEEQKYLLEKINAGKNLIISAPTSFGKSLLIEEIVASNKHRNIIIIQPTLALLDETRRKLLKYEDSYKLIVKTTQENSKEKGNIFLLTAERVLEYSSLPKIDFFVIDEFYKLSTKRDDERSDILNNVFYMLLKKYNCNFILLGPNIHEISNGFINRYNAEFYKTQYSLVENEEVNYYEEYDGQFGAHGRKQKFKLEVLFNLLLELRNEQTIIFCSSPNRVQRLSKQFFQFLEKKEINKKNKLPLKEWIEKNIFKDWYLNNCLDYGIGVHDGSLPKHITSSIIKYFNDGKLNFIFCTTTIIEGVNTSAKNIVYFDNKKGNRIDIDYFDYSNIKGRAGRMMQHYVGKIYNFNHPPEEEKIIVDIPFYEQNPVSDEILINIHKNDIANPTTEQNIFIDNIEPKLKQLIKKNGVSVKGQLNIYNKLMAETDTSLFTWTAYPTWNQLEYTLSLAWENLIKEGETTRPMTCRKLTKVTFDYANNGNINDIIESDFYYKTQNSEAEKNDVLDESVRESFQILRHWFEYKVPKWLSVIHNIQEQVSHERNLQSGSYVYYSNLVESGSISPNLTLLLEYNIPSSAIKKISKFIPENIDEDKVLNYIRENSILDKSKLIEYELDFFEK